MVPLTSFPTAAAAWQNFYLLVGTAAATLVGLMFVAVTFGSSLVTKETSAVARSFLDPTFNHFVQVLLTACFVLIPSMSPTVLGVLLLIASAVRARALFRIFRHMQIAAARAGDLELSDWLSGIVIPAFAYVLLATTGVGFLEGYAVAMTGLAIFVIVILFLGVYSAWETMVWMAMTRANRNK